MSHGDRPLISISTALFPNRLLPVHPSRLGEGGGFEVAAAGVCIKLGIDTLLLIPSLPASD